MLWLRLRDARACWKGYALLASQQLMLLTIRPTLASCLCLITVGRPTLQAAFSVLIKISIVPAIAASARLSARLLTIRNGYVLPAAQPLSCTNQVSSAMMLLQWQTAWSSLRRLVCNASSDIPSTVSNNAYRIQPSL